MRQEQRNIAARNYGLRSRNMIDAGRHALQEGMQSHSSIATMTDRWRVFAVYVRDELGVRDMRRIETAHLQQYAATLRERFERGEISPATAQNYLSTVNRVLEIARGDKAVRLDPVRGAGLPQRSGICQESRAVSQEQHQQVEKAVTERVSALMGLQRELGLRFQESAKIDAARALAQAEKFGSVAVRDGTKGGRPRTVPITQPEQLAALRAAAAIQGRDRSMIPPDQTYARFRSEAYQSIERSGITFHGLRHSYAQARYHAIVGAPCPVAAGVPHRQHHQHLSRALGISISAARELDKAARMQVSAELGHGRIDVTNAYLG